MIKLSNTSLNKYVECPRAYALWYIDKLRPIEEPSPLSFGGAIDKAFTAMLVPGPKTPEEVFLEEWSPKKILTPNFKWNKSDIDLELLEDTESNSNDSEIAFNSLKTKGLLMLKALLEKVLPNIESVISVQEPIILENQDSSGDQFIGFIDFVVKYKGYDKLIIFDLKTATVPYKEDSVRTSQQLTIYSYAAGEKYKTNLAGYIVLAKKIRKNRSQECKSCGHKAEGSRAKKCDQLIKNVRCNGEWIQTVEFDVDVQVIVDEIPEQKANEILELIDNTHKAIKNEEFDQNLESCTHPIYRTKCKFYDYCHNNRSMVGLTCKKDREEK